MVLEAIRRRARARKIGRAIEDSIAAGVGLHHNQWLAEWPSRQEELEQIAGDVIEWCRTTIAGTKRPHGIDHMAIALAYAHPGCEPVSSATFGVFRPVDFYREGGVGDSVMEFVTGVDPDELDEGQPLRFAAALFSWGDVAREAVFADR